MPLSSHIIGEQNEYFKEWFYDKDINFKQIVNLFFHTDIQYIYIYAWPKDHLIYFYKCYFRSPNINILNFFIYSNIK